MENTKTVEALQALIAITNDRLEGFRKVDRKIFEDHPGLDVEYEKMIRQSELMKSELSALVIGKGGDADQSPTLAGGIHRIWIDLKNSITGSEAKSTLENVVFGENAAITAYESALKSGELCTDSTRVVERQLQQLQASYHKFRNLENHAD